MRTPSIAAATRAPRGRSWNLQGKNQPFYDFPDYVNDLPPLSAYTEAVDRADGALDGKWRDNSIEQYENGWATPARIPYQERMIEEVVTREGFGADDVPDLLFINSKAIDHAATSGASTAPRCRTCSRWQDEALGQFVALPRPTRSGKRPVGDGRSPPTTGRSSTRRSRARSR